MLARVLTLRFDEGRDGFDDTALRDFVKDRQVRAIRDYFFVKDGRPYLAVVVTYQTIQLSEPGAPARAERREKQPSWRELLEPEEYPLFNALRDWRMTRSKEEGVPPYIICTNQQLAAMVRARPQHRSQITDIKGFGKAKLEKYGDALLALLSAGAEPAPTHHPSVNAQEDGAPHGTDEAG